jgi:hypothetical protein
MVFARVASALAPKSESPPSLAKRGRVSSLACECRAGLHWGPSSLSPTRFDTERRLARERRQPHGAPERGNSIRVESGGPPHVPMPRWRTADPGAAGAVSGAGTHPGPPRRRKRRERRWDGLPKARRHCSLPARQASKHQPILCAAILSLSLRRAGASPSSPPVSRAKRRRSARI